MSVSMQGLRLALLPDGRTAAIIRTSDRINFKKCRRNWAWSSHLKNNLAPKQLAAPLWFGSAIHYALEDFLGYNKFGHPREAFKAYCIATARNFQRDLPPDAQEHYELGKAMMDYYVEHWLEGYPRKEMETYWAPNPLTNELEPQVEVNFEIEIPLDSSPIVQQHCKDQHIDVVLYRGTIDRVGIDEYGYLWVIEYKTAKVLAQQHYQTDPQVTTYVWAASLIYNTPVAGVVYEQFIKKAPEAPKVLTNGLISTAQNQVTSSGLYRKQLLALYGEMLKAPSKNQAYYNELLKSENGDRDRYIVRDKVHRNPEQCMHEAQKILLELEDMLNPNLPLYPNPTRDCARMCSFNTPCINMDDGSDFEGLLESAYASRDTDAERFWRNRLPSPEVLLAQFGEDQADPELHSLKFETLQTHETEYGASPEEREAYKLAQIASGDFPPSEFDIKQDPWANSNSDGSFNMNEVQQ